MSATCTYTLSPHRNSALTHGLGARLIDHLLADWLPEGQSYDAKEGVWSVELDCAGYKREEIAVEATGDTVTVVAENARRGRQSRSFWVGEIDPGRVTAKLEDGVLTVSACRPEHALPKRVEVKGG